MSRSIGLASNIYLYRKRFDFSSDKNRHSQRPIFKVVGTNLLDKTMPKITNDWLNEIGQEFEKPYYLELRKFLINEYRTKKIFPPMDDIFNAFHFTPLSKVKVLLLGQVLCSNCLRLSCLFINTLN